jgi:hypothetical protein
MKRMLFATLLAALAAAALAAPSQARVPGAFHEATIDITRATVNANTNKVTVRVSITGLFVDGAHWKLFWKKVGAKASGSKPIKTGRTGTTKVLGNGRWKITVKIVQPNGVPYSPAAFPDADFSDSTTVTVT